LSSPDPASADRADRPVRSDARRNREKLVEVARAAFGAAEGTVALEAIAREAGVGIGTLYRHFPTREALVEAVYAAELDDVATSAPALLDRLPPELALRAWMDRYVAFFETKRGMGDVFRAGVASGRIATPVTRKRITGAIGTILTAGARAGVFRADVDPEDVTMLVLGVLLSTANDTEPERIGRLLDLVADSVRPKQVRRPAGQRGESGRREGP
jgi:AcrR family transcriptional regulator